MKVTVEDCLKIDAFQGAQVAAGKSELNNEVRSISVLDAADPEEMKAGKPEKAEILLTSFAGIRGDVEAQCELVRQAAGQGCAALAVYRVGQAIRKLDNKVIRTAEEEDLPLLIMPETAGYSAAITGVMDQVLYGDNFRNGLLLGIKIPF